MSILANTACVLPTLRVTPVTAIAAVVHASPILAALRHGAARRRPQRVSGVPRASAVALRLLAAVGWAALGVGARPLPAQWSVAPVFALGAAVPADAGDNLSEGFVAKAGVWLRAPSIPFGLTVEGLYTRMGGTRTPRANAGVQVAGASLNMTTRRHDRRWDTYLVGGAGYYWHSGRDGRLRSHGGAGLNAGIGEVFAVGGHDLFVELRYHWLKVNDPVADGWMSFMPLVLGVRF